MGKLRRKKRLKKRKRRKRQKRKQQKSPRRRRRRRLLKLHLQLTMLLFPKLSFAKLLSATLAAESQSRRCPSLAPCPSTRGSASLYSKTSSETFSTTERTWLLQ